MFSTYLALLFIIKCCSGRTSNIIEYLSRRYGEDGRKLYRKFETHKKKQLKAQLDLQFLIKYKTYNVIPKFLRFKLYRKSLHSSSYYKAWQIKLLNNEINFKRSSVNKISDQLNDLKLDMSAKFSAIDVIIIKQKLKQII